MAGCDGCKPTPEIEDNPEQILAEGQETYMTVKQGTLSYDITVDEMYINLRNQAGIDAVINWSDKTILKNFSKRDLYKKLSKTSEEFLDISDITYWDQVTDEEIIDDMIAYYFTDGTANYTDEEVMEILQKNYLLDSYSHGYRKFDDLIEYHHLKLAKYKCVTDYYTLLKQADPFTEGEKKTFYKENYLSSFWSIIIPFNSYLEIENTLAQLGYTISPADSSVEGDYNKWINDETGNVAATKEITQVFIDLYNKTMVKKADAQTVLEIEEGTDYNIVDDKIVFNTEDTSSQLYYTGKELTQLSSDLSTYINTMSSYTTDNSVENASWYTPRVQVFNDVNYLILNIKEIEPITYEEAKEGIVSEMVMEDLTDGEIDEEMAYIRWLHNLVIYDGYIQYSYNNLFDKKVTEAARNHETYVAVMDITDKNDNSALIGMYTKEQMFLDLDYSYGPYVAIELVNYHNFLYDLNINNVYDLQMKTDDDSKRVLNEDVWEAMVSDVALEKDNFLSDDYTQYGYPASYGWENFLMEAYGVRTEKELALLYLRRDLMNTYINNTSDLTGVSEDSDLWRYFKEKMQEIADTYFKVDAWTVLITYEGADERGTDPSTWTDEQKALVEEFYLEILKYIEINPANYEENINALIYAYNIAPYLLGDETSPANSSFAGIEMSKYKTAGIKIYSIDLDVFAGGTYGEEIDAAAKYIWDKNPESEEPEIYGTSEDPKYIKSEDGYQIYINIKCYDMTRIGDEGERIIPTLEEIQLYLADEDTTLLTEDEMTVIDDIYVPLSAELGTIYNVARTFYKDQLNYEFTFRYDTYTLQEYLNVLEISIYQAESYLIYTK